MSNFSKFTPANRIIWQALVLAILCLVLQQASFAGTTVIARPTATLNGWGKNAHVGSYEGGVNQGYFFGLNNETTYPYTSVGNAADGNSSSYAYSAYQHTHKYSGCVFSFPVVAPSGAVRTLNIDSEVPSSGTDGVTVTNRSAGIWYSINAGASWTQVYNLQHRARQTDSISLAATQDLSKVQVMVFSDAHDDMYHKVYEINITEPALYTGYINPKYVIVGVTYAPPGPTSFVEYGSSTLVGNTTTTNQSFKTGTNVTVTVSRDLGKWSIIGGAAVKDSNSASTDSTQASNSSSTVTVSKAASVLYHTNGTQDGCHPVNHDYDEIWLWLNPLLIYTLDPNNPSNLIWNGYGYDKHDPSGQLGRDIVPIQVGWLNGHFGDDPAIDSILSRSWVTQYENLTWPAGDGPGINNQDKANILRADPFTSSSYTLGNPPAITSADLRFTMDGNPPNPIPYVPGGTTTQYDTENVNTVSTSTGAAYTHTESFGTDLNFSGGTWLAGFTVDIKTTQTIEVDYSWLDTLTVTQTNTKKLSVTEPPSCTPLYSGPGQFLLYQDNKFGTFLTYPSPN